MSCAKMIALTVLLSESLPFHMIFYAPAIFNEWAYSIIAVLRMSVSSVMSVRPVNPVRTIQYLLKRYSV